MNFFFVDVCIQKNKMAAIPIAMLASAVVPAILGSISSIMGMVQQGRELKQGGRLRLIKNIKNIQKLKGPYKTLVEKIIQTSTRKPPVRRRRVGKGFLGDILGGIPILGSLVKGIGLGYRKGGMLVPIKRRAIKPVGGLLRPAGKGLAYLRSKNINQRAGKGLAYLRSKNVKQRTGGSVVRKGHYRYVNGKRVHVNAHIVNTGAGIKFIKMRK